MTAQTVRQATSALVKEAGDISSVFPSLSGKKATSLPARFATLKNELIRANKTAVTRSWHRLLADLNKEIAEIKRQGSTIIPTASFSDLQSGNISSTFTSALKHRGVAIIKSVLPPKLALDLKAQTQRLIAANPGKIRAFPPDNPAVYELYWSPAQVAARSDPNVLAVQHFLGSLWHSSDPSSLFAPQTPLTYADRLRIRQPGDSGFALGPHIDGGSLERWEDPEYASVYSSILTGNWEMYDAFDARHRVNANMDLYNGAGACSMFRLFQGWLSLSSTGPGEGTLKTYPLLKHATSYTLLRPFFNSATNELDLSSSFPGSQMGACQELNDRTHPHLALDEAMTSLPPVEPGDYVAWHCDTIHSVDSVHNGQNDSSVMYIPACGLTPRNAEFLLRQREAALALSPPPDFPGAGGPGEGALVGKTDWSSDSDSKLSPDGRRAMGLPGSKIFQVEESMRPGEEKVIQYANRVLFE